ncbi:MAG: hypothetical protein ACAH80_18675 [Alphaproteobacteria bacterium]
MTGVTQAEFAKDIGKSRQYVNKLVSAGKLPTLDDGKLDPVVCKAVLSNMADPARRLARRNMGPQIDNLLDDPLDDAPPVANKASYNDAALFHKQTQGQLLHMQLRKEAGELVEKSEMDREALDCARIVRDRFNSLPQEVAGELVKMTDERQIMLFLRNKIRDLLMETLGDVGIG